MGCKKMVSIKRFYKVDDDASYQAKWMADVLNQCGLNYVGLAKLIHVTKQSVCNWLQDMNRISYQSIVTICYKLDLAEDPDEVFEYMKKDWEKRRR